MGIFVAFEGETLVQRLGFVEGDPVLVFVVPRAESAQRIRAAVSPGRIVWESEAGFALVGERVITASLESAGEIIKGAGWLDRPIKIVTLESDPETELDTDAEQASPASRETRLARLRGLVNQPTLSRVEQMFVLQAMNDGIEI